MAIYFDKNFINQRDPNKNPTSQKVIPQDSAYHSYNDNGVSNINLKTSSQVKNLSIPAIEKPLKDSNFSGFRGQYSKRPNQAPKYWDLFKNCKAQNLVEASLGSRRIAVSKDQSKIYISNEEKGLMVLDKKNSAYVKNGMLSSKINTEITDIKLMDDGSFIINERFNNDLVKLNRNLDEVKRVKGIRSKQVNIEEGIFNFITTRFAGDDITYIWIPGDTSVCLVDLETLVYDKVTNFLNADTGPQFITAVASTTQKKVLGLCYDSYQNNTISSLIFLRAGAGIIRKPLIDFSKSKKIFPINFFYKVLNFFFLYLTIFVDEVIASMETSIDDNIVFLGGMLKITDKDGYMKNGVAKIYALTFDEMMDQVSELELKLPYSTTQVVSCILRMPDKDVLICGTNLTVFIVEWTGTHFEILNHFEELHSGNVLFEYLTCFNLNRLDYKFGYCWE